MRKPIFKVGEKIKCIAKNNSNKLIINNIYTVKKCYYSGRGDFVEIEEMEIQHSYYTKKFISIGEPSYEIF